MSRSLTDFTLDPVGWRPYVQPVSLDAATDAQKDALKITPSNRKISDYVLVLAHDPEMLAERTPLFNDIMYAPGGAVARRKGAWLACGLGAEPLHLLRLCACHALYRRNRQA